MPKPSVMIVDDEPALRNMMARTLEFGGYHTVQANDGAEALTLLEAVKPQIQLVVTDIRMPHMDGIELGRVLETRFSQVGIVYVSAYGSEGITLSGRAPILFLQKPFTPDQLLAVVARASERLGSLL